MAAAREMMQGGLSAGQARAINGFQNLTVSAAGSTLATATALVASHNVVTTVSASQGVVLPNTEIGDEYFIYNATTTPLTIYPPTSSGTINQLTAGTGMLLSPYTAVKLKKASATAWTGQLSG